MTAFSTVNFVLASYMCLYFMLLFLFLFLFVFVFVFVFLLLFLFVFSICILCFYFYFYFYLYLYLYFYFYFYLYFLFLVVFLYIRARRPGGISCECPRWPAVPLRVRHGVHGCGPFMAFATSIPFYSCVDLAPRSC